MRASKPAPAMTAKCSPFTVPRSSLRRPAEPDPRRRRRSPGGSRGSSRRGWPCRPAGSRASPSTGEHVDALLHEAVAAPREDELGAVVERPLDLLRRLLALRHLEPLRIRHTLRLEHPAQLEEPSAHRLAGMRDDRDRRQPALLSLSRRGRRSRPRGRRRARRAAPRRRSATPASDVERMVHPAVHPCHRDERRDREREAPAGDAEPGAAEARRQEQRQPAVDGDRGSRVPGRDSSRSTGRFSRRGTCGRSRWTNDVVRR